MSRDNYNSILQNLKIAQADLAKIEAAPDIAKGEYLQALARLDELKRSLASLNILSARYGDDLAKTQKDANAAEDKRKADLEEINNMIDAPMFDLADYITNSEEMEILDSIEGLNKDEINRADKAAKIQAFLEENARTAQNKETKIKEEAQNLLDYFKISEKIRLDNHNPSNECHKKRGEIKNIINDYNKKTDSIKLPKTFKDLQKLAFSKKQADKDNYTKYIAVLENITKENTELNEYIKDFESYILLRQKLENPEKKLNTLIESENKVREHYNNSLKGKIISLSKLNEYKKTDPRIYDLYANVINGLISGYNFRAESREQLVSPYSAVNNTDSKSKKTEAPLPFKNLNEYNTALQSLKDLESAVKLKDHKGTEHKYRDDIRKLIKNYNESPENKHNKLPKDFTSLLDSINEDFDKYTKYSEIIKKLIEDSNNANNNSLVNIFLNLMNTTYLNIT